MAKILLIDDDKAWSFLLASHLQKRGFDTVAAHSAVTGIQLALEHLPALILCDMAMVHGNGYEVACACKKHVLLRDIPIIAVTGSQMVDGLTEAKAAGFDGYVQKALDTEGVVNEIVRYLSCAR